MRWLWLLVLIGWFGYIGRLISVSDIHIVLKILLFIGDLIIGSYNCIDYYNKSQ